MSNAADTKKAVNDVFNIIACGVGGQGVVLMSNVVGEACARAGLNALSGEMHGLSQRSGSVFIHQRIGAHALSPLVPTGEADVILALEPMEALRYLYYLKPDGVVITNTAMVHPPNESEQKARGGISSYITYEQVMERLKRGSARVVEVDALKLAYDAGNALTVNVVMVGALSGVPGFPVPKDAMLDAVKSTVPPKAIETNVRAFDNGYGICSGADCFE